MGLGGEVSADVREVQLHHGCVGTGQFAFLPTTRASKESRTEFERMKFEFDHMRHGDPVQGKNFCANQNGYWRVCKGRLGVEAPPHGGPYALTLRRNDRVYEFPNKLLISQDLLLLQKIP
jgi:hypothetical protein